MELYSYDYAYFRFISAQCLLDYFDRLGVLDTGRTLECLGLADDGHETLVELSSVSAAVSDHVSAMISYDKHSVTTAVTALLSDELLQSHNTLDNLTLQRNNLTQELQVFTNIHSFLCYTYKYV